VGSRFGIEARLVPKMGIKYYGISTGKFRRYHSSMFLNIIDPTTLFKNFVDFFRFIKGIGEARTILTHEKPDVVFAKGGFVSLPVGIAAKLAKVPLVTHESDVVMGLANRKLAAFAEKVCVSFPLKSMEIEDITEEKIVETGNPIRDDVLMGNGEKFLDGLGFDKTDKTTLLLGGSQGSRFLNDLLAERIEKILDLTQIIWIAGERDADLVNYRVAELTPEQRKRVKVYGFVTSEMADVYAASDLVICRSGSNVLFELAAIGKPAILVPYDDAAGGHQLANAKVFSRSGAAYLFRQHDLTGASLAHQIDFLFKNEKELASMSQAMRNLSDLGAAEKVARVIMVVGEASHEQVK
jgi:UDP-N-acetylglucosamine--N-acetylmuramyl-(pentapeptide) pyrophosphoryl-undecaprenol N-acetylglucosamine transferase